MNKIKCKALDYYYNFIKQHNYNFQDKEVIELLENTSVGDSILNESWWEDSNDNFSDMFVSHFKAKEIIDMFDGYKAPKNLTEEEIEEQCFTSDFYTYGKYAPKCCNTKCEYYKNDGGNMWCSYSDWADACMVDTVYNILFAFGIGGWSAIDELKPQFDKRIINRISEELPTKYIGIKEKKIYGDDKMTDVFFENLAKLNDNDDIFVFWDGDTYNDDGSVYDGDNYGFGTMYVNDESEHQAQEVTTLFEAYKFALLINACHFDYVASDKLIKEFGEQLLDLVDEDFYKINIWDYIDDIKDDFKALTGIELDIEDKRHIVCAMSDTEEQNGVHIVGSHSYIAKTLSDYLQKCDNPIATTLRESYLKPSEYDLHKFAKALHQTNVKMSTPQTFMEYLKMSNAISEKCYYLLQQLIKNDREYENDILVGYIDWFGDYDENERYIYCHINAIDNEIHFYESRETGSPKSAYLHDIAFLHMIGDEYRIQQDIKIKFTDKYIEEELKNKMYEMYGIKEDDIYNSTDWGYIYCHMYGTTGSIV